MFVQRQRHRCEQGEREAGEKKPAAEQQGVRREALHCGGGGGPWLGAQQANSNHSSAGCWGAGWLQVAVIPTAV